MMDMRKDTPLRERFVHRKQLGLLAMRDDDTRPLKANRDRVAGYEAIISGADLQANDTLAGWLGQDLKITGVGNFTHGTGYLDVNGFVHYRSEQRIAVSEKRMGA